MAKYIEKPARVAAAGNKEKIIAEFFGMVNSRDGKVSIALMNSPHGWVEPGQTPDFDEYTVVLQGELHVGLRDRAYDVQAGQAILIQKGEWVQYSTPHQDGAQYISVCIPAFSPDNVHLDAADHCDEE